VPRAGDRFLRVLQPVDLPSQLLDGVEELLPAHRERLFPPAETLSMFLEQVLSGDGSCQQAVDAAAIKRVTS